MSAEQTNKKNQPAIRFKGFSGEWLEKTIGDLCENTFGGGTPSTGKIDFWNGDIPWIQSSDLNDDVVYCSAFRKKITQTAIQKSAAKLIPENSIAIVTRVGVGKLSLIKNQYATSQDFLSLSKLKVNSLYASYLVWLRLQTIKEEVQGTSIKGITKEELLSKEINITLEQKEQTQIGACFQQLDRLIAQHQQKHDKLKQIIKALLEKLFPQQGASQPQIRFKDFSGDWEEKALGDVANGYDNLRVPVTAKNRVAGATPYYGANGIQDYVHGYTHDGEFILIAEDGANDLKNYPVQYVNGKIWVNNHAHVLQAKENFSANKYLKYAISQTDIEPFLVGGGRAKLNAGTMMKIAIKLSPSLKEQTQIGNFFQQLDKLINQQQTQLTKLNNIKQSLLNKMFV